MTEWNCYLYIYTNLYNKFLIDVLDLPETLGDGRI